MDFAEEQPLLCPFCGGAKQGKNHQRVSCPCTCVECTDNCEIE